MKKNLTPAIPEKTEGKSAFYQAGEILGSIGFHIMGGKDKLIGAIKKKLGKKKLGKKQTPESKGKKVTKKKSPGKAGKKITRGVKKPAKKANPVKVVRKKTNKIKKPPKAREKKDHISDQQNETKSLL